MSDVQVSTFDGLLGTVLPDVRSEHFPARREHDVSARVVSPELRAALAVDCDVH
jgi:hypothetical protein